MVRHPRNQMRRLNKCHPLVFQHTMHPLNIGNLEVQNRFTNRNRSLRESNHQSNRSTLKERHRPRIEEKLHAKRVLIKILRSTQITDGQSNLANIIQLNSLPGTLSVSIHHNLHFISSANDIS